VLAGHAASYWRLYIFRPVQGSQLTKDVYSLVWAKTDLRILRQTAQDRLGGGGGFITKLSDEEIVEELVSSIINASMPASKRRPRGLTLLPAPLQDLTKIAKTSARRARARVLKVKIHSHDLLEQGEVKGYWREPRKPQCQCGLPCFFPLS